MKELDRSNIGLICYLVKTSHVYSSQIPILCTSMPSATVTLSEFLA